MKKILSIVIAALLIAASSAPGVYAGKPWKSKPGIVWVKGDYEEQLKCLKELLKEYYKDEKERKKILKKIGKLKKKFRNYSVSVFINGEEVECDVGPIVKQGRLLVPIAPIVKALRAEIEWDKETQSIKIVKGDTTIVLKSGSNIAIVNGVEVKLDSCVESKDNRTMVPISFIIKILKHKVEFDDDGSSIIIDDEILNLALNKTTRASSNIYGFTPDKAVDGDGSTRWSSRYSNSEWIYVDLGIPYKIDRVRLDWDSAYGREYKIQVSSDGENWRTVYSTSTGNGRVDDIKLTPVSARYVRMYGIKAATRWGYSLQELKVYGKIPYDASYRYEAENAVLSGGTTIDNNHSGYSGTGFVKGYRKVGASAGFNVYVEKAGLYDVTLYYANSTGTTRTLSVYVNGVKVRRIYLNNLANWNTWSGKTERLELRAGVNTITYRYDRGDTGNVNIDYILLKVSNGVLKGKIEKSPSTVNLSDEGILDWVHWGLEDVSSFNRKRGVTPKISNYKKIGDGNTAWLSGNPVLYSWTGGTPTTSAVNSISAVYTAGQGNGFEITVPASTEQRTLKVYVGAWGAKGKLETFLSDKSAPAYTAYIDSPDAITCKVITLDFKAASSGEKLTVRYTVDKVYIQNFGNITLQAATLK